MSKWKKRVLCALALVCLVATGTAAASPQTAVMSAVAEAEDQCVSSAPPPAYDAEFFAVYAPYGLVYSEAEDALYFGGKPVRYFLDGVDLGGGGTASRCEILNKEGVIDVHTLRQSTDNGDGSVDPFGVLTGLAAYTQDEFDRRDLSALDGSPAQTTCLDGGGSGTTFTERFARYRDYGITFAEVGHTGVGNVYFNGALVDCFLDRAPDGSVFLFHSADKGGIDVCTVYGDGETLIGIAKL